MAGKKTGKRLLTWVLVLVMALSLLPLNALAEEADEADALQMSDEDNSDDRSLMPAKTTYTITFDAKGGKLSNGNETFKATYNSRKALVKSGDVANSNILDENPSNPPHVFQGWYYKDLLGFPHKVDVEKDKVSDVLPLGVYSRTIYAKWKLPDGFEEASIFYLKDPTKNRDSNTGEDWNGPLGGKEAGFVDTTGFNWEKSPTDSSVYNSKNVKPDDVTWPTGFGTTNENGLELKKGTDEWNDIFEAFKAKVEADNGGIILTKDEVDSITLVPYKVSRGNQTDGSYHVDCDVVIKCNFVTVDFMVKNDSNVFASILNGKMTCPKGQAFPKDNVPAAPEKDGYEFDDWYADRACTKKADFSTALTTDTTFYGKYEPVKTYTVTYTDGVGEEVFKDQVYTNLRKGADTPAFDGGKPNRAGYEFLGWEPEFADKVSEDVTYTAQWKAKEYSFTVNYLWDDKPIPNIPSTKGSDALGTEVIPKTDIDGYTLIPGQEKSIKIGAGENVLNLKYRKNLTLTANSKTVTYDGEEQTVEGYTAKDNKNNPVEGLTFKDVTPPSASGTDAGTYLVKFAENAKDKVSDNNLYIVTKTVDGKLTIENRPITITADDVTVKYDGQPHGENGYSITSGSLVAGHAATVTISGSKTDAGKYEDLLVPSVTKIVDAKGNDVTSYYDISYEDGKLTINKRSVTLTSASDSKVYDGTALTNDKVTVGGDGFVEGEVTDIRATGSVTNVSEGEVTNTITFTKGEKFKDSNYDITKTEGKLTITEASAPTPGTFDFNDVIPDDGKVTPAITKTVKGNVGKNFKEIFAVTVTPKSDNAKSTMTPDYYTGEAKVIASKSLKDVPFLFKPEVMANAVVPYGELRFTEAGTYTYTVQEIPGGTSRMSYDTTEYTLTIKVVLDENANTYQVKSWQFTAGNSKYPTPLNIVNTYRTYHPSTPSKPTLNTGDHYAYVMGYPDGTVRPNGSITRAEVSTILFRLLSDKTRDEYFTTESSFTDVKAGAWYNNSIATLEKAGVIVDTAKGGAFRPNEAITRAELAAMLAQFSDAKPVKGVKFSDVSAEHWAYEAIAIAAKMGWIEGYPDGTFRPDATITRAEMMTLVNRALERVPSDEDHLLSKRVMLTFPDCKSGDWFYIAVQEATNSHTYERAATEKNGDEQWTALRANRDWTQLEK